MTAQTAALLDKLIGIQDVEAAKPPAEMDTDLIEACTDSILELAEETPPDEETLRVKSRLLLDTLFGRRRGKRRRKRARALLIAAIVTALIAATSTTIVSRERLGGAPFWQWVEQLADWGSRHYSRREYGDYYTYITAEGTKVYRTLKQFVRDSGADVLVPTEGIPYEHITVLYEATLDCVEIVFSEPSAKTYLSAQLGKEFDVNQEWTKTETIGKYTCLFTLSPGWCQCNFNYNGDGYVIRAETYDDLVLILKNLKRSIER